MFLLREYQQHHQAHDPESCLWRRLGPCTRHRQHISRQYLLFRVRFADEGAGRFFSL